jgi:hypothetical protein
LEHGAAPYRFRSGQDMSYFVKVATDRGPKILWGKDLRRALHVAVTRPQIGDLIGARRVSREPVTLRQRQRDTQGRVVSQTERTAHRTRWELEKLKHFADRARLARRVRDQHTDTRETVRAHPELKSAFLTLRAAEEVAARRIANPQDRERFVALVREAMANSVANGDPLPEVRLRESPKMPSTPPGPAPRLRRDRSSR